MSSSYSRSRRRIRISSILKSRVMTIIVTWLSQVSFLMSEANTVLCGKKSRKQLREVEDAQLSAHRWLRDS